MHPMSMHPISSIKDLKSHIDSNIVEVGDFNTPLSPTDRSNKKSIGNPRTK
jgi:hypothetical protein